jgi:hypothetical protein
VTTGSLAISGYSPASGAVGSTVTIDGAGFTGATDVTLCLVPTSFTIVSATRITATVPAGACNGLWRITTPAGTTAGSTPFTVPSPTISNFSPSSGAVGSTVTINGSNFSGATQVSLCLVPTSFTIVSATSVTATVPAGACDGLWRVTTPNGTAASSTAFTNTASTSSTLYMSTTGSDANPCSQAQPCLSFDRDYRVATPGTTVEVAAGSYPGQTINPDSSKTSTSDVVFRPAGGAAVTVTGEIEANGAHFELRDMTVTQINFPRSADDITLSNVINHGMWMQGPSNISIIGGEISCGFCNYHSHMQNGGSDSAPPRNILYDGVYFHDWHSVSGEHTECLQILGGDNVTIRNSIFKACGTGNGGLGATGDLFVGFIDGGSGPVTKNVLLENNFFYPSGNYYAIQMSDLQNLDLRYNSLASPVAIFDRAGPGTGMDFIGNIMGFSGCTAESNGVAINWRYNVMQGGTCGVGDKNAAAGFVDPNNDLHLAGGSAALNAGDASSYPSSDIDGQSRPAGSGPDAGADEAG